ncbi:MAG: hypothetical protein U9Q24_00035 [Candidatus Ratteibacteria bacterium]|nr:hypothetical protein [Candidatus Ratteibacteria bacterium]
MRKIDSEMRNTKYDIRKRLLKITSIAIIGAFLFNVVWVDTGWAGRQREKSFLRATPVKEEPAILQELHIVLGVEDEAKTARETQQSFEYSGSNQDFSGVDLEHFVWAQTILAGQSLSQEKLTKVVSVLGIKAGLSKDRIYGEIYKNLAEGNYHKEIIDLINGRTYPQQDPPLRTDITHQNENPQAQGVYEAVSNSLDALGLNIKQFGKGVKQILSWLKPGGGDRIDVFSRAKEGTPYQLTILKDSQGQNYIRIRKISLQDFQKAAGQAIKQGTILKVSTEKKIPLTDKDLDRKHRNSQEGIISGIHKRFPYVTEAEITTQVGGREKEKVNGFEEKKSIVSSDMSAIPAESKGRFVQVELTEQTIKVIDNGRGMNAEIISGMFVPGVIEHPEPLSGKAAEKELAKVKVVQDASLPDKISFSRNSEVVVTVDIPGDIVPEAAVKGGLMLEFGSLLDVPESRDTIIIPFELKPGEKSNFQLAVEHSIAKIIDHPKLSNLEKVKYINTLVIGIEGLIQENENYAYMIRGLRVNIQKLLSGIISELKEEEIVFLPQEEEFKKIAIPENKKPLFVNKNLFNWQGAIGLKEIGGKVVRGVTLGGEKHLPLVLIPFKEDTFEGISRFHRDWHTWAEKERLPMIKTDGFIALPENLSGSQRLLKLTGKRAKGLREEEEKELAALLQMVNIITAEEVVTSYEVTKPRENLLLASISETAKSAGEIDAEAINKFLINSPFLTQDGAGKVPADANQKYVLLENGDLVEVGTGMRMFKDVKSIVPLINGYYKVEFEEVWGLYKLEGESQGLIMISEIENLVFSPNKRFVYTVDWQGEIKSSVWDLETGKHYNLQSGFSTEPVGVLSPKLRKNTYFDLQFSRDGKYLTYIKKLASGEQIFVIVKTEDTNEIISLFGLGNEDIEYALNPFANLAFIRDKKSGQMTLYDLTRKNRIVITDRQQLHTDSSGTYTAIVDVNGQNLIYFHKTGKFLSQADFGGEEIKDVTTEWKGSKMYYKVRTEGYKNYKLSKEGEVTMDSSVPFDYDFCEEWSYAGGGGYIVSAKTSGTKVTPGVIFIQIDRDPLQRLDRKGAYKHPYFNLFIDNSDPAHPQAIIPETGRRISYQGEIIVDRRGFGRLRYDDRKKGYIYIQTGGFLLDRKGITDNKLHTHFYLWISENLKSWYLDSHYVPDEEHDRPLLISSEDYNSVSFDGKYFVFVNPKNGDVIYLDPEKPEEPIFVSSGTRPQIAETKDEKKAIKLWEKSIVSRKNEFIQQARSAYQPFLKLIPEEYKGEIKRIIEGEITKLYEDEEQEIINRFHDVLKDKPLDLETSLPFDIFRIRMEKIILLLPEYIASKRDLLSQEEYNIQKGFYTSLFSKLFELSKNPVLNIDTIDAVFFEVLANNWDINTPEQIDLISLIGELIENLKEASYQQIGRAEIRKIVEFLSYFTAREPARHTALLKTQARKILKAKPEAKKVFLGKLSRAFADIDLNTLTDYLNEPSESHNLAEARPFVIFLTNEVEPIRMRKRFIPTGEDILLPDAGIEISQMEQLEKQRAKDGDEDVVMDMDYLLQNINNLPERSNVLEQKILKDITVQAESGAHSREIVQNSKDAIPSGRKGELIIDFYLQKNERGEEEYVEEAMDNGTGALKEAALIISKSTKDKGEQIDFAGFFGTGKYTMFEGVDRLEIISKNQDRAYMFSFRVNKDSAGKTRTVKLIGIRKINDKRVKQGVSIKRITKVDNTIPELEAILSKRAYKTFAGLAQDENFRIYFIDYQGNKQPLVVEKELLSQTDFIASKPDDKETNFGKMKIIGAKDMPLQIIDKAGLRVGVIKEEYLKFIPASLHKHIKELGLIIQIPLALIRGRSAFEYENEYLPVIQKYTAIEFYKAIVYKTLTQTSPQFVFEGLPLDWETNGSYWESIDLNDEALVGLANKINKEQYAGISEEELKELLTEPGKLDKERKILKVLLLLETAADRTKPNSKVSLLLRRLAIQEEVNADLARKQAEMLEKSGLDISEKLSLSEVPYSRGKIAAAEDITRAHNSLRYPERIIVPEDKYSFLEWELVNFASAIAEQFGIEQILLVENVTFNGGFRTYQGKMTMFLNKELKFNSFNNEGTDVIIHELAHLLEEYIRRGETDKSFIHGFISHPADFTHDAVGPFAEAMKYGAAISLANYKAGIAAFCSFKAAVKALRLEKPVKEKYDKNLEALEKAVAENKNEFAVPQTLIFYAEPLLNNCGVIDLEESLGIIVKNNLLGEVILYAEDPVYNKILEGLIKETAPELKITKKTKEELGLKDKAAEIEEIETLIGEEKNILCIIKGTVEAQNRVQLKRFSKERNVPIVIFKEADEKYIYSLADALESAITVREMFIDLPPVEAGDIEKEYKEYKESLRELSGA